MVFAILLTICSLDANTLKDHKASVCCICFSHDSKYLVSADFDKTVKICNTVKWKYIKTFSYNVGYINLVSFSSFLVDDLIYSNFIPIPKINKISEINYKNISNLVKDVLELQKKYHDPKTIGNKRELLKQQIDNVDYEIDSEVYKLYGVTEEEKQIIEESLK